MLLLIVSEYELTIINLVVRFFEHMLQRVLLLLHNLPEVFGGRPCIVCGNLPEQFSA